ncbi:MAG TPA: sugar ABC transporter ATP-binding protein [Solirubrobacteraceae bacterium]|jgi:rhamnose transport system ATP-binding protein|nr:sugar ABC transporter ATP-binding protein [Solirubrobacteraceae bacterium]
MQHPLLAARHVSKSYGGVAALTDVSLELFAGEAHALIGENGAGKSTLVKMLGGVLLPDSGLLEISGEGVVLASTADARDRGIAVIYQEPTLFPDLTVAENVFIGRQPLRSGRRIDFRAMDRAVNEIFARLGVRLDPDRIARGLSIAEQQLVEIAKALSLDAKVVIMDEPTASLSPVEVERLFRVVQTLRSHGTAVLFISHRLEEAFALCQRVTVLRDGTFVMSQELEGLTAEDLIRAMVGRDVLAREHTSGTHGRTVLQVEHLTREGVFVDVSFEVRAGEVVALAGLVGAGRTEVARAVFGIDRYDAGTVTVAGTALTRGSPTAAMAAGIGLVPEDRRQQGLVMDMSIADNISLASLPRLRRRGLLFSSVERAFAADWATRLQVKYGRMSNAVSSLSGGNQQKVVLAKWLSRRPSVLIVDEPTRGIDIGTKVEVHRLLAELAADGVAVLVISSELPEVLTLADRILVMREGRLAATLNREDATEERIIAAGTGQLRDNADTEVAAS